MYSQRKALAVGGRQMRLRTLQFHTRRRCHTQLPSAAPTRGRAYLHSVSCRLRGLRELFHKARPFLESRT